MPRPYQPILFDRPNRFVKGTGYKAPHQTTFSSLLFISCFLDPNILTHIGLIQRLKL
jgi:hypothetical protein